MYKFSAILIQVIALTNFCRHGLAAAPRIHSVHLNHTIPLEYSALPAVAKCCPIGEVFVKRENGTAICAARPSSTSFSPLFSDFNSTGLIAPGEEHDEFVVIVGDPCRHNRYMLMPEESSEDEYYLMYNGSIYAPFHVPPMLNPRREYCMEDIPEKGLRPLVCFPEQVEAASADSRITFYAVGLLISVPFLLATVIAYALTPRLRDVHGKALCCYSACLAVAFFTLAIAQLASNAMSDPTCITVAFVIQSSFVACFFWLNVMCIETWLLVRRYVDPATANRIHPHRLFFFYSVWAWGLPAILILVSMWMDLSPTVPSTYVKPNFGAKSCWFSTDEAAMPYFYVPVGLLVLANAILFVLTGIKMARGQRDLDLRRLARNQESDREDQRIFRRLRRTFIFCVVLYFVMGTNWVMELISWWAGGDPLAWSVFDLVNALQGIIVFGLFVLRKPARNLIWYRIQKILGNRDVVEPEVESMDLTLLPVTNDSFPRQRMTQ